ncbi:MAG TPA: carboxy terminal-processing peptidase [Verrucomicrobiae bacterium]|jgi:carboxyl-terminal processing protease
MRISLKLKICGVLAVFATAVILFTAINHAAAKDSPSNPDSAKQSTAPLLPGPNDSRIAYLTARSLENNHYLQEELNEKISAKFFNQYIEMLDPRRENFLQSDMDEFAQYRTKLGDYTIAGRGRSDLTPAYVIFERFQERFQQHTAYDIALLKQDHLNFDTDERILIDRRHASWPKDMTAAQNLWRQELTFDFLQERLGREISSTNAAVILPLPKNADAEIADKLLRHYNWVLHLINNSDSDTILEDYLDALAHAYDPHSDYMNGESAQSFMISMSLGLFGIGAQLREDEGYCTVDSLVEGGPAKRSGLIHQGDRIVAVAQSNQPPVNVVDMDLPKVVELIRGPKGTQVRLTLTPADHPTMQRIVALTRDEIKLADEHARAELIDRPDGHGGTNRIGILDLPSFYASMDLAGGPQLSPSYTTVDVRKLITKLKQENVSGIILDLRSNPGGSLQEAVSFTGLFTKGGPVVLSRDSMGQVNIYSDNNTNQLFTGPMVVLVNRLSASAAEIAAAALQDYGRALVVGDVSTFGKGTVQDIEQLRQTLVPATLTATNDPGDIKITISKFYRVTGASTQFKGVVPDIVLPDVLNYSTEIGETNLENALPWDTMSSVPFDKQDLVTAYVPRLREDSNARIATNRDFSYLRQDINEFKKMQADQTTTLNEQQALRDRQKIAETDNARDAERALRPVPNETKYAITLENAVTNGLPAPESLLMTNFDATVIETNANGTVMAMSTNQDIIVGIKMDSGKDDAKATVVTRAGTDTTLEETERILQDYISMSSSNTLLIANP